MKMDLLMLHQMLNSIGIYTFNQVSKMTEAQYQLVDELISALKDESQWLKDSMHELATDIGYVRALRLLSTELAFCGLRLFHARAITYVYR